MGKLWGILVLVAACDFGGESVEYDNSCTTVECPNADDTSIYQSDGYLSFDCIWHCAEYKGDSGIYVHLTFASWEGSCYQLSSEYVSSGICQ